MIDNIIARLLAVEGNSNLKVNINEIEIEQICAQAQEIFKNQPMLLELDSPIKICGDTHGQYGDLLTLFKLGGFPPIANYLFLGDYVDRGENQLETICLLLALKIKHPVNFFMLRGNHELADMNEDYGFLDTCENRFHDGRKIWKIFNKCFSYMPAAAIIKNSIFCCHGGLSPTLRSMDDILDIKRPCEKPTGLLKDLLWADPDPDRSGWHRNIERNTSYTFGADIVKKFLIEHKLSLICRAHQVVDDGYEFFANKKLVTVFSAPDYSHHNAAAILSVNSDLSYSFQTFKSQNSKLRPIGDSSRKHPKTPSRKMNGL